VDKDAPDVLGVLFDRSELVPVAAAGVGPVSLGPLKYIGFSPVIMSGVST
jgi:hypothetical protein